MRRDDDELTELRSALRADAAEVAEALLGPPNKATSSRNTLRFGRKSGSLVLEIRGTKKGLWREWSGTEGGDLLGLIQHTHGCDFPTAVAWARKWTGIDADEAEPFKPRARPAPPPPDEDEAAEAAAELAEKIATAQRIAAVSVPIAGTPGEYYLKQVRGIATPAKGWPDAIRWHPAYRALVAVATKPDGTVRAVQRVHLGRDGGKIGPEEQQNRRLHAVKLTNGQQEGAAVRLPGDPSGPVLLAEGPETGLAAYTSTGFETWIALGGIGKLEPPAERRVVAVADDNPPAHDARKGQAAKALRDTARRWRKAGIDLVVVTPWQVRRRDKSDMADVILANGREAVRARIMAALEPAQAVAKRVPVHEAWRQVAAAVGGFFSRVDILSAERAERERVAPAAEADAQACPGPAAFTHAVRVDVGVGKSHQARERAAELLAAMRARGDKRTVVLAVPMHALGDEQAASFMALPAAQAAGLHVEVWRGRAAPDPTHPDYLDPRASRASKATMCGDLERVRDAQAVGLSAQTSVCKRRITQPDGSRTTVACPLFNGCAYQAQTQRRADLWIMAHNLLFHEKPSAMGEVAAVVVDEAAWRKGLNGAEGRHVALSLDALAEDVAPARASGIAGDGSAGRLRDLRRQLLDALRGMPDGPVRRDAMQGTLLTADSAAEAHRLEWARKVEPLHPGQTRAERQVAMEQARGNRTIARLSMAWDALRALLTSGGPEASGWIALATEQGKDGPVRVLHLKGRREVADGWQAPTLLLDALLPVELVRPFWPDVELVADVKAAMPHQRIRQVVDRAYAKSMLEPLGLDEAQTNPKEAQRRTNRLHDLRAMLVREARRHAPGKVLAVMQQAVETALHALGRLPLNVQTAHHNAVAGRDEWRDVAAVIVVGRTQPSPVGAERIAAALTGQATPSPVDWYERADALREMADGSTIPAEADRHPDPVVEAIRWQTAEGELIQIIGRGRGVNRTAANPLDVLVLTDLPLPVPLAGTLEAAELEPDVADQMMAAGGMVVENPAHAAAAYPFLWLNREAAKKALQRGKLGTFPYRESNIGECPQLLRVSYQQAGQGKSPAVAGFDPALCPDPVAFLTGALGPLAWWRLEEASPPLKPGSPFEPEAEPPNDLDGLLPEQALPRSGADPPSDRDSSEQGAQAGGGDELGGMEKGPAPVCDVLRLHPEVPAYALPNGQALILCPHCGQQHRHGGFGHRLAHCDDAKGAGYVLVAAGPAPPWVLGQVRARSLPAPQRPR